MNLSTVVFQTNILSDTAADHTGKERDVDFSTTTTADWKVDRSTMTWKV